jgi:hypothetical protein
VQEEVVAMKSIHVPDLISGLFTSLLMSIPAWAQAPAAPFSQAPAAPAPGEAGPPVTGLLTLVVLLGIIVGLVKLFDFKRKRDDQAMALEARISDVLLVHPALTGLPIHVVPHVPLSRPSEPIIEIRGTVPTPALRAMAVDTVRHEVSRQLSTARIEDRIMVDPLMPRGVA